MVKSFKFKDRQSFREWLTTFGEVSDGIWLLFNKKDKKITLTSSEALEEALCHGWIDGKMQSIDHNYYKKYFARRLPKSQWSPKNKELAQALINQGLMTTIGIKAIEEAKKNGLWEKAARIKINDDQIEMFKKVIQSYEPAYRNFNAFSNSIQRTYTGFYFDAKTDKSRCSRLEKIISRLNMNLKPM
jgi:uncharacterized protein YdeI (YjbR/CyaY-like superfamily)